MAENPAAPITELPETEWSGLIMWDQDEEGKFQYYVFEYTEMKAGAEKQIKFPGGTNADRPNETSDEILHREVRKETGLRIVKDPVRIYREFFPANPKKKRGPHWKNCYLVRREDCQGELITQPGREDGTGDHHTPIFPRTAEQLFYPGRFGHPLKEKIFWTHRPMLRAAMKELGDKTYIDPKD